MKTWSQINLARLPYIGYATRKSNLALAGIRSEYARQVREFGEAAIQMLSEGNLKQKIESLFIDIYTVTGVDFAKKQIDLIKSGNPNLKLKQDWEILESQWVRDMREFAVTRCAQKIQISTRTLFEDIVNVSRSVFTQVPETGWGADRIAKEIMKRQGQIDAFRALRIARTEIVGASNEGSFLGAQSFPVEVNKVWVATFDGKGRPEHENMHDTSIKLSEKFVVPLPPTIGGESEMDYPGDPDAHPANVIQCRCGVVYEPVNSVIDRLLNE